MVNVESVVNLENKLICVIENFQVDAKIHLKYLKIILFVHMLYLLDIKFFDNIQFSCVTFIILFQLAFTQNMLNNLSQRISEIKIKEYN